MLPLPPVPVHVSVPPAVISFACGGLAGALGAAVVYPVDYLKTQLQTEEGGQKYRDGLDAFRSIVDEKGPMGLYRGLLPQICGVAPEKALKIFVNDAAKVGIAGACGGVLPVAGEALAGFTAGCCQVVVTNPLEAVKIRLQTSSEGSAMDVVQDLGWSGLYNGATACMLRDGTFSLMLFPLYAHAKEWLGAVDGAGVAGVGAGGEMNIFVAALSLGLAGLVAAAPAAALSTPLDVIKTRVQATASSTSKPSAVPAELSSADVLGLSNNNNNNNNNDDIIMNDETSMDIMVDDSGAIIATAPPIINNLNNNNNNNSRNNNNNLSVLDACQHVIRTEGMEALFSGWLERVLRSAPQFAVTLSCADLLKHTAHAHGWM